MSEAGTIRPRSELSGSHSDVIRLAPAIATWAFGWLGGMLIVAPIVLALLGVDGSDYTIPELAAAMTGAWLVFLAALSFTSRKYGSGRPMADFLAHYAVRFRPIDLVGLPLGVVGQLVLVPLLYLPLREWWPDTFSEAELEERAQELADKAGGANTVLLVLIVAIGAPIVEELVYRGLLQRSMMRTIGAVPGLAVVAIWFALVHPSPVEYPGLLLAGLLFGGCLLVTGRLGASIVTHAAFNAVGLALALW